MERDTLRGQAGQGQAHKELSELGEIFRYEAWANRRILAALREAPELDPHARRLFAHLQSALKVWRLRLLSRDSRGTAIWPELSLEESAALLDENEASFAALLVDRSAGFLGEKVSYVNQHGLAYETAVGDILRQVFTHGAYHRGQIALLMRQSGVEPVNTDYITYTREMAGQPWKA